MKILLDNCTPAPLRKFLLGHEVKTAFEMGWADLMNGALLAAAEAEFELMITCDQNLRYQQNLSHRKIRLLVLTIGRWPILQQRAAEIAAIVEGLAEAGYAEFPS
jgi:predicted nuclease of predicted toxin-antitoxin system